MFNNKWLITIVKRELHTLIFFYLTINIKTIVDTIFAFSTKWIPIHAYHQHYAINGYNKEEENRWYFIWDDHITLYITLRAFVLQHMCLMPILAVYLRNKIGKDMILILQLIHFYECNEGIKSYYICHFGISHICTCVIWLYKYSSSCLSKRTSFARSFWKT